MIKNWKTTLGGLLFLLGAVLPSTGYITEETGRAIQVVGITLGFTSAKDFNVRDLKR